MSKNNPPNAHRTQAEANGAQASGLHGVEQASRLRTTKILFAFCFLLALLPRISSAVSVKEQIEKRMKEFGAETVGIYFESSNIPPFVYNPDTIFHAASTMKVPVMMEVFRQVEAGKLNLNQRIVIKNEFRSILDGSPFSLTAEEDSDTEIYKEIGKELTLGQLVERMIHSSSNMATNIVIELVGAPNVMELMKQIGAKDMTVLRGVEDLKAYEAGKNNTTSARALAVCLSAILDPKWFQNGSRNKMFEILLSQQYQEIAKGIRAKERGLKVASKDGFITGIRHDAAIIRDAQGRTSVLVILTRGVEKDEDAQRLVAVLASDIWARWE